MSNISLPRAAYTPSVVASGGDDLHVEGAAAKARFACPQGIAYQFDPKTKSGRLLVADRDNECFRTIDLKSGRALARSSLVRAQTYCVVAPL
jgi:hypothetical protein